MNYTITTLLSVRQRQILQFIRDHYTTNGYAPSVRDIGGGVGLAPSAVMYQIGQLERAGWVRRHPHRPRTLVVLNPADGGR